MQFRRLLAHPTYTHCFGKVLMACPYLNRQFEQGNSASLASELYTPTRVCRRHTARAGGRRSLRSRISETPRRLGVSALRSCRRRNSERPHFSLELIPILNHPLGRSTFFRKTDRADHVRRCCLAHFSVYL